MTDERFIYQQDIQEKKITGRGAFHKKNGSKSKKCNFPSDYLTKKEKEKLSGECVTFDMKKFYTFDEFKQMPSDIQLQYVNSLINRYAIGLPTIAYEIFGISASYFHKYLEKTGIKDYVNNAPTGRAVSKGKKALMDDVAKARNSIDTSSSKLYIPPTSGTPINPTASTFDGCKSVQITTYGFHDHIYELLKSGFDGCKVQVTIKIDTILEV